MSYPTLEKALEEFLSDPVNATWYYSRPEPIQKIVSKYPYKIYKIKIGAPYQITCPGSIVHLLKYHDNGEITVQLKALNKLPQTIEYEKTICSIHNRDEDEMHCKSHEVRVKPDWLEPYFK